MYSTLTRWLACLGTALLLTVQPAQAEPLRLQKTISAPDHVTYMGTDLTRAGNTALVALRHYDPQIKEHDAAQLIDVRSGAFVRKLRDPEALNGFGDARAFDIDGDEALVCGDLRTKGEDSPSARLYNLKTGTLLTRYTREDANGHSNDRFGWVCSFAGDKVLISAARNKKHDDSARGVLYVFDRKTGKQERLILPLDPMQRSRFGEAIAASDGLMAVSTTGADFKRGYFGYVDLYDLNSGAHLHRFQRPDNGIPYNSGNFGLALILQDGHLIIASSYDTLRNKKETGTVWVYDLTNFKLRHRLLPPPSSYRNSLFGLSLSLWEGQLLVGAPDVRHIDPAGGKSKKEAGRAYLFDIASGAQLQDFPNPSPDSAEYFGHAVHLGPDGAIISASRGRTETQGSGELYVYEWR